MELAHTGDDGLTGLLIGVGLEGGVFFRQLCKGNAHLFLASLGLGLNGNTDNRLRELHGLKDDLMLGIAEGVAGGGLLQTDSSSDIACVAGFDVLPVVGVHHQDAAHTLGFALGRVINRSAGINRTGVNTEEAELSDKGVRSNLERQSGERLGVGRMTDGFLTGLRINTVDGRNIDRRRHIVNDGIQQLLHALVTVSGAAADRNQVVGNGRSTKGLLQLVDGQFLILEEFFHQSVVSLSDGFHHLCVILLCLFLHIIGDVNDRNVVAQLIVVDISLHLHQVDDALEVIFGADGELNGQGVAFQTVMHHMDDIVEVRTHDVHLVNERHTGDFVFVSLMPNGFRLGFYAALGAENGNGAIQDAERTFHFNCKVHVTGGIDNIDPMTLPESSRSSRSNRNTPFLLLCHPVHRRSTLVGITDLMRFSRVVQDSLGSGGFAGVDVSHYTNITSHFERYGSWHNFLLIE